MDARRPAADATPVRADRLRSAEGAENFPVALRVLPARVRGTLRTVYDVVRTIDDVGDDPHRDPAERLLDLHAFAADLATVWTTGRPRSPVLAALDPRLPREPFDRLVAANIADQHVTRYRTWDELLGYCALSADPVGRLVLAVFDVRASPEQVRRSDLVCTALQLLEHWQDVAEDHARGRTYLPAGDMAAFGVTEADLDAPRAGPALRRLVLHETDRAVALLDEGSAVVDGLRGWARVAVAGYVAGGRAAADALRRSGGDVLAGTPRARRVDVARHLIVPRHRGAPMTSTLDPDIAGAYATCETITRTEARNFFYGIRLLPPAKRSALSAVYALARRIDDIGDGDLPTADKVAALAAVRASLRADADRSDPVVLAVADAARRYPIPLGAFDELVDGVEADVAMDASGATTFYGSFDDMVGYCRQVAGSVGRLCLGIFGSDPHPDAALYADQLGIALQQTNILRDIREDLQHGRIYLPAEDLDRFGVELTLDEHGVLVDKTGGLAELIAFAAGRARDWYADGLRLVPLLDRRSAACATAMSGIYRRLLDDIAADPPSVYHQRRSLTGWAKVGVAARSLAGRA